MMQRAFSFGTNLRMVRMVFGVSQVKWVERKEILVRA